MVAAGVFTVQFQLGVYIGDPVLADQFDTPEMAQLIGGLTQIGQMDPAVYPVRDLPQVLAGYGIPLDEQTLTLVDAYGKISASPEKHLTSVRNLVHFMLSDKTIRKTLSRSQRKQLKTLRKIIDTSVSGKRLSPAAMGKILGMKSSDVRSVYLLYQYKHGGGGWTLSPQQFINFLVGQVLTALAIITFIEKNTQLIVAKKTALNIITGLAWAVGNVLVFICAASPHVGQAIATTFSQLGVIVSTYGGIVILHEHKSKRQMAFILFGTVLITVGAVLMGMFTTR